MAARLSTYAVETQVQSLWCWAAVASSVAEFYERRGHQQCLLATKVLRRDGCCTAPSTCNTMASLADALTAVESYAGKSEGTVPLESIQRQIDFKRPVGIRIGRDDGTGHVVSVIGYDDESGDSCTLEIGDPWTGRNFVRYGMLVSGYGSGRWSHTYFTT